MSRRSCYLTFCESVNSGNDHLITETSLPVVWTGIEALPNQSADATSNLRRVPSGDVREQTARTGRPRKGFMKPPSILLHSHFHSRDLFRLLKCPVAPSPHFNALYSLESLARKAKTLTLILYLSRSSDLTHPELAIIYGDQKAEPFLLTTPPLRFLTKLLPSTVCLADPTSFNEANS